jgi:hypothetical protein
VKKILLTTLLCFSGLSIAAGPAETSGTVKLSAKAGKILISVSKANSSCGNKYYITPDTDYNKALLSMLLSAQMANKTVWINGSGACLSDYPYYGAYQLVNMAIIN